MSRYGETSGPVPNPSQYYLEWNSELNSFSYWKKEEGEDGQRIAYPLPFRFAALKFMSAISGYDKNRSQGIYSNEVADTRYETFRVLYRDGTPLAQGLYSQIKDQVKMAGGHFVKSIYAVTTKGAIVNIKIKGGQMINFGIIEKFGLRYEDEWIEVSEFESKVDKDDRPYSLPVFKFSQSFDDRAIEATARAAKIVQHYLSSKAPVHHVSPPVAQTAPSVRMPEPTTSFTVMNDGDDDDLPF